MKERNRAAAKRERKNSTPRDKMPARKISHAAVILLLLLSLAAGIYLILSDKKLSDPSISRVKVSRERIGVVSVSGEIYFPFTDTGFTTRRGAERIISTLESYRTDDTIKAVIVRINSPGGSIGAVQEIVNEIERIRKAGKPVIASIADIGASGGYYVAAPADMIIANEGSIVGSIGVIMASGDFSRLMDKLGIKIEIIKSGEYKDTGSFHRPLTEPETEYLQEMVDDAFEQFINTVSLGRDMPYDEVKDMAQGQVYTGRRALELNLIDDIGGFSDAVKMAEELAGITDAAIVRERYYDIGSIIRIFSRHDIHPLFPSQDKYSGISYLYTPR